MVIVQRLALIYAFRKREFLEVKMLLLDSRISKTVFSYRLSESVDSELLLKAASLIQPLRQKSLFRHPVRIIISSSCRSSLKSSHFACYLKLYLKTECSR